jgi:hypothetical protein
LNQIFHATSHGLVRFYLLLTTTSGSFLEAANLTEQAPQASNGSSANGANSAAVAAKEEMVRRRQLCAHTCTFSHPLFAPPGPSALFPVIIVGVVLLLRPAAACVTTTTNQASAAKLPSVVGGTAFTVAGPTKVSTATPGASAVKARGSYTVAGRKQWRMVSSDDMAEIQGWTKKSGQKILEPVTCSSGGGDAGADAFLGPRFGTGSDCNSAFFAAQKTYNLPPHTQVRVTGRYHFIDSWSNDTYVGYAKVGERTAWSHQYNYCHKLFTAFCREYSISVCGDDRYPEKLSHHFDFTLSHTEPTMALEMGMDSLQGNPLTCTQIRSWGVDDVEIFVR